MKPVGQRTVIDHGQPADEDAVLMHETFELAADYARDEPGPHPARLHEEVHRRRGRRGPRGEDRRRPRHVPRRPRHAPDRGDRPRRCRGGDRAVERGRRGDARRAGDHRQRGRRRPADRRDRPQRLALRGARRAGRRARSSTRSISTPSRGSRRSSSAGWRNHGIRLLGVLPVRPILSNPTLGMVLEGVDGETIHPGPDLDRVIDGVAIGAMEPSHMLERVGPGTLVIVPGDREDVILTLTTAHLARRFRVAGAAEAARIAQIAAEATNERTANVDGHEGAAIGLVLTGGYRPRDAGHRRDPPGRPLRDDRPRGHLRGRVGGPRPAREDPPGRPREDRADQGARRRAPRHRADPRRRHGGAGGLIAGVTGPTR